MKILDTPRSGKCGTVVAFKSRFGLCLRQLVIPKKTRTPARDRVWGAMGYFARAWSAKLTQEQQERWIVAAGNVLSATRLNCGPLTGQQFFESINCARVCINQEPFWDAPPPRPTFSSNPLGQLTVTTTPQGLRLLLAVTAPVTEDVMVFGQAPCSTGRHKRRNVAYLGLLPPAVDGFADITDLYTARYGALRPHTKIFILTRQQKNGWESPDKQTSAIVPAVENSSQSTAQSPQSSPQSTVHSPESGASVAVSANAEEQQPAAARALPSIPHMHTGGTGAAHGVPTGSSPYTQASNEPPPRDANAAKSASAAVGGDGSSGVG
jgi:hypothetical protein